MANPEPDPKRRGGADPAQDGRPRSDVLQADRPVRVRSLPAVAGWAAALLLALWFFGAFSILLLGILGAGAIAAALRPVRDALPLSHGVSGVIAGSVPILLLAGLLVGGGWLATSQLGQEVGQWSSVRQDVNQSLDGLASRFGIEEAPTVGSIADRLGGWVRFDRLASAASMLSGVAVALALVLFGQLYLLAGRPEEWSRPLLSRLPPRRSAQTQAAVQDLDVQLRRWVVGTAFSMALVGAVAIVGFWLLGLRLPVTLGLLAGFAEIVPTVGPVLAFLVAIAVASTQGGVTVAGVAGLYLVVQLLESYVLLPLVMKRAVRIPPFVTLFAAVFWGKVFGVAGVLLAVPLVLLVAALGQHLLRERSHGGPVHAH